MPKIYYRGGMMVQTTRNIDKTMRTAREVAELQHEAYEALAENLAAAQRRGIELAEGGLKFVRLQEDTARAAQEWFANGVRLLQLQQRNAEFAQGLTGEAVEAVREQTEHNARTAEAFARGISKQQKASQTLTQESVNAYMDFLSSVFSYPRVGTQTTARSTRKSDLERSAESDSEEGANQADAVSDPLGGWGRVSGRARTTFGASRTPGYAASARRT